MDQWQPRRPAETIQGAASTGGWWATMMAMSAAKPKIQAKPKAATSEPKKPGLKYGFPGTEEERAEKRRKFADEHKETLRRLGK
jgi:hypothetical protein